MVDWLAAMLVCAGFVWAGWPWAKAIPPVEPPVAASLALSYLAGTALVSLAILGEALLGLPINRLTLLLAFLVVRRMHISAKPLGTVAPVAGRFTNWTAALLGITALAMGYAMVQAVR